MGRKSADRSGCFWGSLPLLGLGVLLAVIVLNGAGVGPEDASARRGSHRRARGLAHGDEIVVSVRTAVPSPLR